MKRGRDRPGCDNMYRVEKRMVSGSQNLQRMKEFKCVGVKELIENEQEENTSGQQEF